MEHMVRITVQNLIDALSKIENKEQYILISHDSRNFTYLQSVHELTNVYGGDSKVVVLIGGFDMPVDNDYKPNKIL